MNDNTKQEYCPLSIEIKGKTYCFKTLKLDKECNNCIKDDSQRRDISDKYSKRT